MQSRFVFRALLFFTMLVLFPRTGLAQTSNRLPTRPSELQVRVTYDNDHPVDGQLRVDLLAMGGATVGQQFTRDQGQVSFYNVFPGNYRLKVSGIDVEENSEVTFTIEPRETVHFETVHVKLKKTDAKQSSNEGNISAAVLNIPDKAHKEFDKGMTSMQKK